MATPADWVKSAVKITPGFETTGDPYMGVSGDFDGMGISCGALQWNIGKKSLQPMVLAIPESVVTAAMPGFGPEMLKACKANVIDGLKIVRQWQTGQTLKPKVKAELRTLMGTPEMRKQQDIKIGKVADLAFTRAASWAKDRDSGEPTKRLFCWFFDIVTQNGSLEGLTPAKVRDFIALFTPGKADDVICDFLANRTGNSGHVKDAHKNAKLWRDKADAEQLEVLCMSFLRAETASPTWRHVVLNRKGAIAMGKGWVNSAKWDFGGDGL